MLPDIICAGTKACVLFGCIVRVKLSKLEAYLESAQCMQIHLHAAGQFGTRLQGGKDSASARYIFTRMTKLTRHLFNAFDDRLLNYLNEEGQQIEPEW